MTTLPEPKCGSDCAALHGIYPQPSPVGMFSHVERYKYLEREIRYMGETSQPLIQANYLRRQRWSDLLHTSGRILFGVLVLGQTERRVL